MVLREVKVLLAGNLECNTDLDNPTAPPVPHAEGEGLRIGNEHGLGICGLRSLCLS